MGLVALGADNGFTAGDFDVSGYFAAVDAYQVVFVADGRPYSATIGDSGYHKIDMTSTVLVGEASGAFTLGELITQAATGAAGTFMETVGSGATTKHLIYRTTTIEFDTTEVVGAISTEQLTPTAVKAPPHWLNWTPTDYPDGSASLGFPDGGSNAMCLFDGRIWMNSMWNPNQFFATRQGNPLDLDTSDTDVQAAISSQTSLIGKVGDAIITFIPFKDNYLLFACASSFSILRGGSTGSGQACNLTSETGIFSPDSYCWDNEGNLYIIGLTGMYKLPNNMATSGVALDNITLRHVPNLFRKIKLNRKTDRVVMGFDPETNRIQVAISTQDGSWSVNFNYDIRNDSIIPDTFSAGNIPSAFRYVNSPQDGISGLLIGTYDGYVKKFDVDAKSDDGEIISSKVLFGPVTISSLIRANIKIKEIDITLATESDGLVWELYQAESNELLANGIKDGTLTPTQTGTFTGGGKQAIIDEKIAGESIGILFSNTVLDTSWAVEGGIKIKYSICGQSKKE